MYRIIENTTGTFTLANQAGCLVRTTASDIFITRDRSLAEEALEHLNLRDCEAKRLSSYRIKSMFGVV